MCDSRLAYQITIGLVYPQHEDFICHDRRSSCLFLQQRKIQMVSGCGEEKRILGIQKRFLSKKEADIHCLSISGNLPPGATTFATLAAEVISGILLQRVSESVCIVNPGSRKEARRLLRALTREPAVRASFWGKDLCNS